jgi:hypothetical protein
VKPFVVVIALFAAAFAAAEQNAPQPPRASVEIPQLKTAGQTIRVPAGGDLQKALDEAKAGDRIELQPRATYQGPFRLKAEGRQRVDRHHLVRRVTETGSSRSAITSFVDAEAHVGR